MSYLGSGAAPQATQIGTNSVETQDIQDGAVTQAKLSPSISLGVRVSSVSYPGDDTAADTAGGQTITVTGAGFSSTPTVYVDTTIAPSVTYVSSTQITFTAPAKAAGTYNIFVINPDGSTAIHVMGLSYSGTPTWTTPAGSLGTVNGAAISIQLVATGDAPLVYTLSSGSSLPAGVSLSSSGLISGTLGTAQTISFSVDVTDAQNQTTPRSFSVTISLGEAYFRHVTLLLHGNGTNNAQNNTFLDSSTNAFTITRNGNTTQGTFSPFSRPDGRWSNYFAASYASIAYNSSICDFGTGSFTIEMWVYLPTSANSVLTSTYNYTSNIEYGWYFGTNASGNLIFTAFAPGGNGGQTVASSSVFPANQWVHVAIVRNGSDAKLYINGQVAGSNASFTQNITYNNSFLFGTTLLNGGPQNSFTGYMSNVRVVKGSAVYTSAFTPSTTPLTAITNTTLLTCQSNRFKDNSTNNFTFTPVTVSVQPFSPFPATSSYSTGTNGGSGYFDGSGDYLSGTFSSTTVGSGDFTIEFFYYPITFENYDTLFGNTRGTTGFNIGTNASKTVVWYSSSAEQINSGTLALNSWNHIAFTRTSNTLRLYVNGSQTGATPTVSTNFSATSYRIGDLADVGGEPSHGYISGLRVVTQSLASGSTYTVPTAPPTAISNTSLLLNFTNGGIIDHSMSTNLETVGNASISTTQSKWGGGSISFDGSGDMVVLRNTPDLRLSSTEPFTIEFWVYANSLSSDQHVIGAYNLSSPYQGYALGFGSGGVANTSLGFWDGTSPWRVVGSGFSTGTWYHVAIASEGSSNTGRFFVNGVQQGSSFTVNSTIANSVSSTITIGARQDNATNFNGYIDDLRITKGYARYTSNFTPPTGPFDDNGV